MLQRFFLQAWHVAGDLGALPRGDSESWVKGQREGEPTQALCRGRDNATAPPGSPRLPAAPNLPLGRPKALPVILGVEWGEYQDTRESGSPHPPPHLLGSLARHPGIVCAAGPCVRSGDFHLLQGIQELQRFWGDRMPEKWTHQPCTVAVIQEQACTR